MKMLHVTIQTEKFEAEVQFYLNNTFPIRRTIQNSEIATIMCRNSLHSSTVPLKTTVFPPKQLCICLKTASDY